ncbi:MAG TPA: EAL domain-containing protein [Pyrinomonadaceae bacterium]|jgi:diguanylate cyclase (GGDEF)-like protein/PAS domain S-box-containing protein
MNINPVKVLLIDDDEEDYILTRYVFDEFKDHQFKLEWVDNFEDGLRAVGENRHDIYLVDYRLGEGTGLELLREAIKNGCPAPIILLTGQGDKEIDFQAMQAGAADYLVKSELTAPLLERAIRYNLKHARSLEEIQNSEAKFRSVIQTASDAILLADEKGKITLWNKAAESIFGYREEEIVGFPVTSIMGVKYAQKAISAGLQFTLENVLKPFDGKLIESTGRRKDGSEFPLELSGSVWRTSDGVYYTGILRDITERRAAEDRLVHEATHDSLTGLPNRAHFTTILQDAITCSKENENHRFAVLFLDLDRFKVINDGLGHVIGDKLLIALAGRLASCVRPGDVVSRFGGDEFTILLNKIGDCSGVTEVAERLQQKLSEPFFIDSFEVFTSASIGIILSEASYGDPESFLRDADTAMYRAKETGKAHYEIFNKAMHVRNMNLLQMENDLRKAIERDEFCVYYQPIVMLESAETNEFEALVRWNHPERGFISPNEFIPVAEETGLIVQIGEWVLRESCRQINEWRKLFPHKQLSVSVNLSAKQLMHPNLVRRVKEIMSGGNLPPVCLKLEVTESMVMDNAEMALEVLSELCALGVRLSTDDFGTGYSSLSYLHRFPFERLKIDRSFVGKMDSDAKSEEIVRTILTLAENLHLEVVAEGIETEKQFLRLRELGCALAQGYFFSKPVAAREAEKILRDGLDYKMPLEIVNHSFSIDNETVLEVTKVQ